MATIKKIINTSKAPELKIPASQAVVHDKTLYVSGVVGMDPQTLKLVEGGVVAEARQALKSLGHILEAAGSSYDKVIKTTVFLNDIEDYPAVNEVYKEFFIENCPARSCFQVGKLPVGAQVEIEVIAAVGEINIIPKL